MLCIDNDSYLIIVCVVHRRSSKVYSIVKIRHVRLTIQAFSQITILTAGKIYNSMMHRKTAFVRNIGLQQIVISK